MSAIVIDSGSSKIRAGIAGDDAPSVVIPSTIRQENENLIFGVEHETAFRPIVDGLICNFEQVEKLWSHVLTQASLGLSVSDLSMQSCVMIESPSNTDAHRVKMFEILFEKFGFGGALLGSETLYSLFASGRNTATIVHFGTDKANGTSAQCTKFKF